MPRAKLRIAEEFSIGLSEIYSARLLSRIEKVVRSLVEFPEMGSPLARPSLTSQYGDNLRKIAIETFLIVYRCDGQTVDVLAFVYGPSVV